MSEQQPQHAAIVLAAGQSQRLGQPKQALLIDGHSLESRALALAAQTQPQQLLLVRAALDQRPLPAGMAMSYRTIQTQPGGMGISLRCAIEHVDASIDGYLILSVDMPALDLNHLQLLLARWREQPAQPAASAYAGTVGMPALLPQSWRPRLLQLDGDQGARDWLRSANQLVTVANPALAFDIDTPTDLAKLS